MYESQSPRLLLLMASLVGCLGRNPSPTTAVAPMPPPVVESPFVWGVCDPGSQSHRLQSETIDRWRLFSAELNWGSHGETNQVTTHVSGLQYACSGELKCLPLLHTRSSCGILGSGDGVLEVSCDDTALVVAGVSIDAIELRSASGVTVLATAPKCAAQ